MPRTKTVEKIPPRRTFHGYNYRTGQGMTMTGKEWNEYAKRHQLRWKKSSGSPLELFAGSPTCGSIELYLDGTRWDEPAKPR